MLPSRYFTSKKMHQLVFCGKDQKETIYSLTHTFSLYIGCVFIMYDLKRWWWCCGRSKERKQQQSNQQYCFDQKKKNVFFSWDQT